MKNLKLDLWFFAAAMSIIVFFISGRQDWFALSAGMLCLREMFQRKIKQAILLLAVMLIGLFQFAAHTTLFSAILAGYGFSVAGLVLARGKSGKRGKFERGFFKLLLMGVILVGFAHFLLSIAGSYRQWFSLIFALLAWAEIGGRKMRRIIFGGIFLIACWNIVIGTWNIMGSDQLAEAGKVGQYLFAALPFPTLLALLAGRKWWLLR